MAIGGSLLEKRGQNLYNTFNLHIPDNSHPIKYEKIHLIPQLDETKWLTPGKELTIHKNETLCAGLMICYDIRFPELLRKYVIDKKINLLLVVAQWPQVRIDHWIALLRARAIENQVFIAAVNAVGDSGEIKLGGNSCIVDPWGRFLITGNDEAEVLLTAELDLSVVDEIRSSFPVLNGRREDIYYI